MADYEGIIDGYRVREVTGIGPPRVFPLARITRKKQRPGPVQEEAEYPKEIKEEEPPRSGEGVDIEA